MAKRFTDSRKWHDPWYRKLPAKYKSFWIYILDTCDHAGIWKVDFEMAEFCIGEGLDHLKIIDLFDSRIVELKKEIWFIPKFIEFQYGELNPDNRAHKSVIDILEKEGANKHLTSPLLGCKDKVKDKEEDKGKKKPPLKTFDFEAIWAQYPKKMGKKEAYGYFNTTVINDMAFENIKKAIANYLKYLKDNQVEAKYVKSGCNWFDDWESWTDYKEYKPAQQNTRAQEEDQSFPEQSKEDQEKVKSMISETAENMMK